MGGSPRPPWMRIGTRALGGEREHRLQAFVREQEPLRPRMELDAARAEIEAALGLLDRELGKVESHERDQPAAGLLRPRTCGRLPR